MATSLRTGTMGWSYDDWRGTFYETDIAQTKMLESYARVFDTVELDTTFYGAPRPSTLTGWVAQVPPGFLFSAKVPRAVTHERRLVHAVEAATDFANLLQSHLGDHLGALLLQLPPDFTATDRRTLDLFVSGVARLTQSGTIPPGIFWVVEFRHASWTETDVAADLAGHGFVSATTERVDLGNPLRYVRLLGEEHSVPRFDVPQIDRSTDIADWAERLKAAMDETITPDAPPILVYARNYFEGHAPATLFSLRERLGILSETPPGQQQLSLF